jgi:hypothetical protein
MNAIIATPERTAQRIQDGLEFTHSNPLDVDFFRELGSVQKEAIYDRDRNLVEGYYALRNSNTQKLLASPPVSKSYKLVDHSLAFLEQAKSILDNPSLPHDNFTVVDRIFDEGRRATRAVYFNDLTFDIDGKGEGITARADIINSVDMSWAFQVFSGAYRDYCRNTCVFGGQKAYHQKRKHTANLSVSAMIAKSTLGLGMFNSHRDQMNKWRTIDLDRSQWVEILENTVCKKGGEAAQLSVDKSARVNGRLLDYLNHRFVEEERELGSTMWGAYNALTHWATHVDETWERENDDGTLTELSTSRGSSNPHRVRLQREAKVRQVLESPHWLALEQAA